MANWSTTTKHEPSSINNGRRYELRDRVSIEQLNNMTENAFYAMDASSVAKEKAEQALKHAVSGGSRVLENGQFVTEFNADKKVDTSTLEENYYNKQQVDDKLANLEVDIDFSNYYTKTQTNSLLDEKADKSELENYVTNQSLENKGYLTEIPSEYVTETEMEGKGYLTKVPNNVAYTDEDNSFQTSQSIYGHLYLGGDNPMLMAPMGATDIPIVGAFISFDYTDGTMQFGSNTLSKIVSPNIIEAQGLTDGTTTKTMTEVLAGGGVTIRRWTD